MGFSNTLAIAGCETAELIMVWIAMNENENENEKLIENVLVSTVLRIRWSASLEMK